MILFYKDFHINKDKIKFKKSRQCSKDFTFIPMKYEQQDIIIQTPHCFVPFGLHQYSTVSKKKYLDFKKLIGFNENFTHTPNGFLNGEG